MFAATVLGVFILRERVDFCVNLTSRRNVNSRIVSLLSHWAHVMGFSIKLSMILHTGPHVVIDNNNYLLLFYLFDILVC